MRHANPETAKGRVNPSDPNALQGGRIQHGLSRSMPQAKTTLREVAGRQILPVRRFGAIRFAGV
jgi:hypothetical protein